MKIVKIIFGAIVLAVAVWLCLTSANPATRFIGTGILTFLGLALLIG